jgi:hypothetical protein
MFRFEKIDHLPAIRCQKNLIVRLYQLFIIFVQEFIVTRVIGIPNLNTQIGRFHLTKAFPTFGLNKVGEHEIFENLVRIIKKTQILEIHDRVLFHNIFERVRLARHTIRFYLARHDVYFIRLEDLVDPRRVEDHVLQAKVFRVVYLVGTFGAIKQQRFVVLLTHSLVPYDPRQNVVEPIGRCVVNVHIYL